MLPWAHAALGYLCYTLYRRGRDAGLPSGRPVIVLAFGTQLPDLVDKPLAWYVDVLPYGRTLGHSLVTGGLVVAAVVFLLRRRDRAAEAAALAVGYGSHLLGDAYRSVLAADWLDLSFLLWPALPIPDAESELQGVVVHLLRVDASPLSLFEFGLTFLALALWVRHGVPGLSTLWAWVSPER